MILSGLRQLTRPVERDAGFGSGRPIDPAPSDGGGGPRPAEDLPGERHGAEGADQKKCPTDGPSLALRQAIGQQKAETGADLIVMGTHGRTGLRRLLMGSVAEQVVRKATCPVLTVRTPVQTLSLLPSAAEETVSN